MVNLLELLLAINFRKCDKQILQNCVTRWSKYNIHFLPLQMDYRSSFNMKKYLWITAFTIWTLQCELRLAEKNVRFSINISYTNQVQHRKWGNTAAASVPDIAVYGWRTAMYKQKCKIRVYLPFSDLDINTLYLISVVYSYQHSLWVDM